jgi:DNA-binding XRE family transcriptional regulator
LGSIYHAFIYKVKNYSENVPGKMFAIGAIMENNRRSPDLKAILANIARERQKLGYTQEYVGLKMGISQNAYSKIELGHTSLTVEHLLRIARILDVSAETLLTVK